MNSPEKILTAKIAALPLPQLRDVTRELSERPDFTVEEDLIFDACLIELERRLAPAKFVAFCDSL
jgi:hypothetical protein